MNKWEAIALAVSSICGTVVAIFLLSSCTNIDAKQIQALNAAAKAYYEAITVQPSK